MNTLRPYRDGDFTDLLHIVNSAAEAYRGVIPADRWHDPYMTTDALAAELTAGIEFWVSERDGQLAGVMGIQPVRDVELIRHAYVRPGLQRGGVGRDLLRHLCLRAQRPILVGTWAAAHWAIDFYRRNGFASVPDGQARELLRKYWSIPERQIETSVVLEYERSRLPV
jgi:N-acetylglutamate synthase-like GNAT family acetyltransferase